MHRESRAHPEPEPRIPGITFAVTDEYGDTLVFDTIDPMAPFVAVVRVEPAPADSGRQRTPRSVGLTLADVDALGAVLATVVQLHRAALIQDTFRQQFGGPEGGEAT